MQARFIDKLKETSRMIYTVPLFNTEFGVVDNSLLNIKARGLCPGIMTNLTLGRSYFTWILPTLETFGTGDEPAQNFAAS
jgi:hypothetical protein